MKLIDIFESEGKLHAWISNGKNYFVECQFSPRIHVFSSVKELRKLQTTLSRHHIPSSFQRKKTIKGIKTVLTIITSIPSFRSLVRSIEHFGNYSYEIFHADLPLAEWYMFENHLFPTGEVDVYLHEDYVSLIPKDSPFVDYDIPLLKTATLSLSTSYPLRKDFLPELQSITFNDKTYSETDMIHSFVRDFTEEDSDIILTNDGHIELPYLLSCIRKHYPSFSFSRFGTDQFTVNGNSYFSYGKMYYKYNSINLKGRLHLKKSGTLYGQWSMIYPFEIGRICRMTLQRANNKSIGSAVSNLQLYYAMKKGFLIPYTSSCTEVWKSGYDLFQADRGAFIFEPRIGFHTDVAEIDFVSLFPSIMVNKNISTETLFCRCCRDNTALGLNINICRKEQGIMGEMLAPIINQRLYYKEMGKEEHANALKGFLVCCFGYMGFKKSKFARIESHQCIQAYAREILLAATKIAEDHGFEVLHGFVDCLWIKKDNLRERDLQEVMTSIKEQLKFAVRLEGIYRWIMFLPSTDHDDIPVPNRYYGVFQSGEIKCRGIEVRKHDTPILLAQLQEIIISELAEANNENEFVAYAYESLVHLQNTIDQLGHKHVKMDDLVITKGISKTEYSSSLPQSIILKKLRRKGFSPQAGQYLRYVITHKDSSISENRYSDESLIYDKKEYIRLARKAVSHLFNYQEQHTLLEFFPPRITVARVNGNQKVYK